MNRKDKTFKIVEMNQYIQKRKNTQKWKDEITEIAKKIESKLKNEARQNYSYVKKMYYRSYDVSWIEDIPNFLKLLHFMAYMTAKSASETFELECNIEMPVQITERYMKRFSYKIKRMRTICDLKDYDDEEIGLTQNSYIDKLKYKNLIRYNMLINDHNYHSFVICK